MKLLLDEDVPQPLLPLLRHLLREHQVEHVSIVGWRGKQDRLLFRDAAASDFGAVLTNDIGQFNDPAECSAIQQSRLHHISYRLDRGLDGLALASAAICAAIRPVADVLGRANSQRIVSIQSLAKNRKRFSISDPSTNPPSPYWP